MPQHPYVVMHSFERRVAECQGIHPIRFHDQRHTHATLLLENGERLKYVAERLGDRENTVLETYGHVTARMRTGAMLRLAALIESEPPTAPPANSSTAKSAFSFPTKVPPHAAFVTV